MKVLKRRLRTPTPAWLPAPCQRPEGHGGDGATTPRQWAVWGSRRWGHHQVREDIRWRKSTEGEIRPGRQWSSHRYPRGSHRRGPPAKGRPTDPGNDWPPWKTTFNLLARPSPAPHPPPQPRREDLDPLFLPGVRADTAPPSQHRTRVRRWGAQGRHLG